MPFSQPHADAACNFFELVLRHSADEWWGKPFILCPWQEDALLQIFGNLDDEGNRVIEMVYLEVPKKPICIETPIPTQHGWTKMADLLPGDFVFDEHGKPTRVLATTEVFTGLDCYAVRFSDGEEIIASGSHEWLTTTKKPHKVTAKRTTLEIADSLMYCGMRNHRMPVQGALDLPDADLPLPPWLLGYWLGNGTTGKNIVTCGLKDEGHIREQLESDSVSYSVNRQARAAVFSIDPGQGVKGAPSPFASCLIRLGVWDQKHIPELYLRASVEQRMELLCGLMDSDGDVMKAGGGCRFSTCLSRLRDDVCELVRSLGFLVRTTTSRSRLNGKDYGESYRLYFTPFMDVCKLRRKADLQRKRKDRVSRAEYRYIVSVTPVQSIPVKCITVESDSHLFLAGRGMIPTGNSGKTEFAAGVVLLVLVLTTTPGCQVYGAAAATRQAMNVYRASCKMIEQSPILKQHLRIMRGTNRIVKRNDPDSFYAAVAADGDFGDGVNPAFTVADEVHRWKTRKQLENWDVLSKGGITRKQTLTIAITTAGIQNESPLAWMLHEKTRKIEEGIVSDPRFYGRIYAADKTDDPADPATWIKANPSLIENGGFLDKDKIRKEYDTAVSEGNLTSFRRYFTNVWDQKEDRAVDMVQWDACKRTWKAAGLLERVPGDPVRPLHHDVLAHFIGRRCWAGVDLSMTTDTSAVAFVFPCEEPDEYDVLPFFWLPDAKVRKLELKLGTPLAQWARDGFLELSPGDVVDYRDIKARLEWGAQMFDLQEICWDPWNSRQISVSMVEAGYKCSEVRQGYRSLNEPTKKLLELIVRGALHHGGHPVLRWHAGCATTETDGRDNIMLGKPDRDKSTARIDGMAAIVNALSQAMVANAGFVYTGLRSVG